MGSPIDAEVDLELVVVARGDRQPGELGRTPDRDNVVAVLGEGGDSPLHRRHEPLRGGVDGEQVDVLRRAIDQTVLAEGASPGQGEVIAADHVQDERRGGALLLDSGRHYRAVASSGKQVSHRSRQRFGRRSCGHTRRNRSALRSSSCCWQVPSRTKFS